jgi:hypothetical protein
MPRRRTIEQRDKDARAVELRRRHLNYRQIAAEMGYADQSGAYLAVQRGLADTQAEANDEVRRLELERLDDLARAAQRVLAARHYVVSVTGKAARHPDTDAVLTDDGPALAAIDRLLKIADRRARLLGLDAPVKSRVEVVTEDAVDAEIKRLEGLLGERDSHHSGTS